MAGKTTRYDDKYFPKKTDTNPDADASGEQAAETGQRETKIAIRK